MLILKAVHEARLQAKEAEIAALKDEIRWLRHFIQPTATRGSFKTQLEADLVIGGAQEQVEAEPFEEGVLSEEERAILAERDRILSGTY